jgi:hypothetical protein
VSQAVAYYAFGINLNVGVFDDERFEPIVAYLANNCFLEKRYSGNGYDARWLGIELKSFDEANDFPVTNLTFQRSALGEQVADFMTKRRVALEYIQNEFSDGFAPAEDVAEFVQIVEGMEPSFFITWGSS